MTDFSTHVFISYTHVDNDKDAGAWVSRFHKMLHSYLKLTMRRTDPVIWRDKRLSDNEVFDNTIIDHLKQSAVMIAVISDNYVASSWCVREARTFCENAEQSLGLAPQNLMRVFKVIKRPPESEDPLPSPMKQITGTKFYVRLDKDDNITSDRNDFPVELDPGLGEEFGQKLRLRINRLAQEIGSTLKVLAQEEAANDNAALAGPEKPTIYLAECCDDQLEDYEALRSELLQRGYRIVPNGVLPTVESECRAEIARLLATSVLSVHLLGERSGTVPGGEGADSVVAIQNELALEQAKKSALRRIVSLPEGTEDIAQGEKHRAFLNAMRSDAAVQGDCELITDDLEGVKAAVHHALKEIENPAAATPQVATEHAIYVIFERSDLQASRPLRRALKAFGTVLKPAFEGEPAEVREANMQNLAICDAVVVFYGSGSEGWKAAVDGDILRARALRDGKPFHSVTTVLAGQLTDDKDDLVDEPDVVDACDGFEPQMLAPIGERLAAAKANVGNG